MVQLKTHPSGIFTRLYWRQEGLLAIPISAEELEMEKEQLEMIKKANSSMRAEVFRLRQEVVMLKEENKKLEEALKIGHWTEIGF